MYVWRGELDAAAGVNRITLHEKIEKVVDMLRWHQRVLRSYAWHRRLVSPFPAPVPPKLNL